MTLLLNDLLILLVGNFLCIISIYSHIAPSLLLMELCFWYYSKEGAVFAETNIYRLMYRLWWKNPLYFMFVNIWHSHYVLSLRLTGLLTVHLCCFSLLCVLIWTTSIYWSLNGFFSRLQSFHWQTNGFSLAWMWSVLIC